jgi:hypothetical protein
MALCMKDRTVLSITQSVCFQLEELSLYKGLICFVAANRFALYHTVELFVTSRTVMPNV